MNTLLGVVTLASIILYAALLILVVVRWKRVRAGRLWLALTIILTLICAALFLPGATELVSGKFGRGFALTMGLAALVTLFGALVIVDLNRTAGSVLQRVWLGLGMIWLAALAGAGFAAETITIGYGDWLAETFSSGSIFNLTAIVGLVVMSAVLLVIAFRAFYLAALPEVANRALFWIIDAAVLLVGLILVISGSTTLAMLGLLALAVGVVGAVYAQMSYRVFDIRSSLSLGVRSALVIIVTALIVFGALYVVNQAAIPNDAEGAVLLAALALGIAIIYVPVRQLADLLVNPLFSGGRINPTMATRKYSQQVSKAVEIDQLLKVATETLNQVMGVRRSSMVLVNDTASQDGHIEMIAMSGGAGGDREIRGYLSKSGPVYQQLAVDQSPLSQFDLEFSPRYHTLDAKEREFFANLQMSAFAPIIVDSTVIGVLACGPKQNDAPFYPRDLELLATMANQTGVALRNARLVADLRHLNKTMRSLNSGLEEANSQLEKLDSVKTEFVTIASHELRTPLAQIRGYTDILDALNQQGMLNPEQTSGMVSNLRKAAERMEELITAMLDVSQLDVNAMDLRFAQTTPEAIIRMAIEPLTDAIKQRKLTLSARGLRGLPAIEADMQRLVQAFRNIVVNAIKFTPDGGRIEITASLQPGEPGQILVAIADTGVGIAKENLELIFEKFFRAYDPGLHSTGTYKFMGAGPGLGLTIARGMIEGHGGRIWAESPGHSMETHPGSTFYVLLPLVPPENARRVLPAGHKEEKPGEKIV